MLNDFYLNLSVTIYTFDKQPLTTRPLKLPDVMMINGNVKTSDQKDFRFFALYWPHAWIATFCIHEKL